jgi:hypothetical protein
MFWFVQAMCLVQLLENVSTVKKKNITKWVKVKAPFSEAVAFA